MEKVIDILFDDLKEEKQREVLEAFGIEKPEDANWDVFPVAVIAIPED